MKIPEKEIETQTLSPLQKVELALQKLREGKIIVLSDKSDRENEGDAIMAAQFATPEAVNFMIRYCRGLVCAPITQDTCKRLSLFPMVDAKLKNQDHRKTNFTISIDHKSNTTGISALDRATTLKSLSNPNSTTQDFIYPGHIFPLLAEKEGLKTREGHTEATIELLQMAKLNPVGIICEIINDDGTMARYNELRQFCHNHDLLLLKMEELLQYKELKELEERKKI